MKIRDLRVRINSYMVLGFLVLVSAFGYALVAHQGRLYQSNIGQLKKSIGIFHQLNHGRFEALTKHSNGDVVPMSGLGELLKLDEFLFIRLYDAQGKPQLHVFNDVTFTPESVEAKFPAPRITRDKISWSEEDLYLIDPPRVYALGVYSTPVLDQGQVTGYIDYFYDLSAHKDQSYFLASMIIVNRPGICRHLRASNLRPKAMLNKSFLWKAVPYKSITYSGCFQNLDTYSALP